MPKAAVQEKPLKGAAKKAAVRDRGKDKTGPMPEDQPMAAEGWDAGMDQQYELVDVDSIKEHPDNYNVGDEAAIRASMDVNGWFGAVLVQRSTGYIIAHNHAYRVAKLKGALKVPVIWKDVDDVEALRILVDDNETARRGYADNDRLDEIRSTLGTLTLDDLPGGAELAQEAQAREAAEGSGKGTKGSEEGDDADTPTEYGLVVLVETEEQQEELYNRLREEGLTVRPVSI